MVNIRWSWTLERAIPSESGAHRHVIEQILEHLERESWASHDLFSVRLALEEALVNAIKHGNRLDRRKLVRVACKMSRERLWIKVADEGPGFEPDDVPDPTEPGNLGRPSGRGIMLMRSYMTRVAYNETGNVVEMEKERVAGG